VTPKNFSLDELANAFESLPGIGPKTAQRMAIFLLYHDRKAGKKLSSALAVALEKIINCKMCNSFSENDICSLCSDLDRDSTKLCIVETPADQMILEQTNVFRGMYYVLMGKISPLDGVGPKELNFSSIIERVSQKDIKEVILATNFTPEGEATAHAIESIMKGRGLVPPCKISRLAKGVPFGAEIEFTDLGTIAQAVRERKSD